MGWQEITARQLAIMRAVPSEVMRRGNPNKGPVNGRWLTAPPIQMHPLIYSDLLNTVMDTPISDAKKLEWELDLLREYDEKRFDRFEALLVSRRNTAESTARAPAVSKFFLLNKQQQGGGKEKERGEGAARLRGEYYKDKGRQAWRGL